MDPAGKAREWSTERLQSVLFVERLLDETRAEIDRADSKASIMLGGTGAATVSLIGMLLTADVSAAQISTDVWLLASTTAICLVLSVSLLVAALHPRIGREKHGRARYFMDYAQYGNVPDLFEAIAGEIDDVVGRHLQQLRALAAIAKTKYRLTILGERAAASGFLGAVLTALAYYAL